MKNKIILLLILVLLVYINLNAQISFLGFDQPQCGILSSHNYSYDNSVICHHGSGYKIFNNGVKIYEKCWEAGGCQVADIFFINNSVGFLIEENSNGHTIYKTTNSGVNWNKIGHGAPTFLGLYLVNANTGYLITTYNNPKAIYLQRISDINQRLLTRTDVVNDTIISDTIFGNPFCEIDTLGFKIRNENDTVIFKIAITTTPLSNIDKLNKINIKIFPNPVNDYIIIRNYESLNRDYKIKIYDYSGNIIKIITSNKEGIFVGDLETGIYFLEISDGKSEYINKFMKN